MRPGGEKTYYFEGHTLDLRRGCLRCGDDEIEMRPKSFEVLRYLVENAGRLVSKDELIQAVWPTVVVTDDSLTHCVSELRKGLNDSDQRIIRTVPRRGYLLVAQISSRAADDAPKELPAISHTASHIHPAASSNGAMDDRRSGQSQPVERRQLTIISSEIVGLSELSTRLDAEDFSIVNAKAHRYCSEIIARCQGHVAHYRSDGVLAYFGYPCAREHDAENGVRAGLNLIASAELLGASGAVKLLPRVGIASGVVIVSGQADTANERMAVGGALNLADRLQAAAKPGSLVIAESTRRLVGGCSITAISDY